MKQILLLSALIACAGLHADFALVRNGRPCAAISIPAPDNDGVLNFAAKELRHHVQLITGADPGEAPASGPKIIFSLKPEPEDAKRLAGSDGYALRTRNGDLILSACEAKGILNGVYRMLYRNTDIIWAHPDEKSGTVFTPSKNLIFRHHDYLDRPDFVLRGWQQQPRDPGRMHLTRNCTNWITAGDRSNSGILPRDKFVRASGMRRLGFGGGHNLTNIFLPAHLYFEKHPEFYAFIDGRRRQPREFHNGGIQLCFTNRAMTREFIRRAATLTKPHPDVRILRVMAQDNWNLCQCAECRKPIKLADGRVLTEKDKAFRSTQYYLWLNEVAEAIHRELGMETMTLAYFHTEIPPECPLNPHIHILYAPIYKDAKFAVDAPQNAETLKRFLQWRKLTDKIYWREYYGLTGAYPRPEDRVALADWRFILKHGINRTYSEMVSPGAIGGRRNGAKIWDVNALYFWVLMNAPWDVSRSVESYRQEYLTRVFGPGGRAVGQCLELIEREWPSSPGRSKWNDNPGSRYRDTVLKPGLRTRCLALLDEAQKQVVNPKGKILLERFRKTFEDQLRRCTPPEVPAKRVKKLPAFDPDFASAAWRSAPVINDFERLDETPAHVRTEVRVLTDDENLAVGFRCFDPAPDKIFSAKPRRRDFWPLGDLVEVLISGDAKSMEPVYYQFSLDSHGRVRDARNHGTSRDTSWNSTCRVQTQKTADGWSAMLTVPWRELGFQPGKSEVKLMFLRYFRQNRKKFKDAETLIRFGGSAHQPQSYGELRIR